MWFWFLRIRIHTYKGNKPFHTLASVDFTERFHMNHQTGCPRFNNPAVNRQDIALLHRPFEGKTVNINAQNILRPSVSRRSRDKAGFHQPFGSSAGKQCAVMVQIFGLY